MIPTVVAILAVGFWYRVEFARLLPATLRPFSSYRGACLVNPAVPGQPMNFALSSNVFDA
ncbi:hypothetical protein MES5069_100032 [Mesorhizobium escarrei]|uniref:Uncharacterized protein n=1 Tax=Mesorhizobium escarrei TaxID=666018 RepID=A0ABM9DF36_9HYPH|nr:hypothetical protein MES5069_100032 [Mesorhizobium escarrei]